MKVAILGPLDLEYMGGGETNSMMVADILSNKGVDVTYFGSGCPLKNVPIERLLEEIKFTYRPSVFSYDPMANPIVLKYSSLLSLGLIGMVGKKKLIRMLSDFDVIFFSYPSLMARRIIPYALKEGKRVILANHGTFFEYFGNSKNPISRTLKRFGEQFILKPFAAQHPGMLVHTQTSFQSSLYRKLGYKDESILEIPQNNVDFTEYDVGKNKGRFHVVFLGRVAKSKGIHLLAEVIRLNPSIKFSVIGNGPLLDELMRLTRDTDAEILGYVSTEEKRRILRESDAMIVPSIFDSLSIASIEGLAAGLPLIVSSTAEGPKYILGRDQFFGLIGHRDALSFNKMVKYYENLKNENPEKYFQDKNRRREKALEIFDAKTIKLKLMNGFEDFISSNLGYDRKMEKPVRLSLLR